MGLAQEEFEPMSQRYDPDLALEMFVEAFDKYHELLDFDQFQETQPVIGILSTEVFFPSLKSETF
jgi:hypothetical protein